MGTGDDAGGPLSGLDQAAAGAVRVSLASRPGVRHQKSVAPIRLLEALGDVVPCTFLLRPLGDELGPRRVTAGGRIVRACAGVFVDSMGKAGRAYPVHRLAELADGA